MFPCFSFHQFCYNLCLKFLPGFAKSEAKRKEIEDYKQGLREKILSYEGWEEFGRESFCKDLPNKLAFGISIANRTNDKECLHGFIFFKYSYKKVQSLVSVMSYDIDRLIGKLNKEHVLLVTDENLQDLSESELEDRLIALTIKKQEKKYQSRYNLNVEGIKDV